MKKKKLVAQGFIDGSVFQSAALNQVSPPEDPAS
jgi:hypothetical protein